MKPVSLKCHHITNPVGFLMDRPVLQFIEEGGKADALRILISLNSRMDRIVYDSGFRKDIDPLGFSVDMELQPRTRYFWQVQAETPEGEISSEIAYFETGKRNEPWKASFIKAPECAELPEGEDRLPVFRSEIPVREGLETASLYISAAGLYEAWIGSRRVGSEYMTPYCNNYHSWLQVQSYDITEQLEESHLLSVMLGDGWYKGRFGWDIKKTGGYYGDTRSLIAEIHLVYEDGTEEVYGTDESWHVTRSDILFSGIYDGEIVNAQLGETAPVPACIDEKAEKTMKPLLQDRLSLPVRIMNEVSPVELIHTPAGETVLDLGQEVTGIFDLKIDVPAGQKVYLQVGEILQEGNFFRDNLRSAKAEYTFISDGKPQVVRPHFCFYGYRYVKVQGIENLKKEDFTALVLHSDLELTGEMTTGNALINQLLSNVRWGQKGNFLDVPTDCPQRDERMGWTGDAEVFCQTACYWMDSEAFYRKYLYDMYTEQQEREGAVPNVIPSFGLQGSACAWGDAATIIPWELYRTYGDKEILKQAYPGMKAWADYIARLEENDHQWEKQFHFGDWLALDHPDPKQIVLGGTPEGFLAEVYYLYSTRLTGKAAGVLGLAEEAASYEKQAEEILHYIRDNYYSLTGRCCIDTMTAHLMTLVHGLSTDPEKSEAGLLRLLDFSHGKLKTGFIGTPNLCPVLTEIGEADRAYDLLFNEEYPGWLYEVKHGATTIWERWNSVLEDGRLSDLTMNSLNHYAYGSIAEWIWRFCAGLDPDEEKPGFRRVLFRPYVDERMGFMHASYRSASGVWKSSWEIKNGELTVMLEVPSGCEALVTLPFTDPNAEEETYREMGVLSGDRTVKAGRYEVTYRMQKQNGTEKEKE